MKDEITIEQTIRQAIDLSLSMRMTLPQHEEHVRETAAAVGRIMETQVIPEPKDTQRSYAWRKFDEQRKALHLALYGDES